MLVQDGRQDEAASWVDDDVPVYHASKRLLESITGFPFHRGFLAVGQRPISRGIETLSPDKFGHGTAGVILAPVGVSQRENLGPMIRTATALGIEHMLIDAGTADPFSRRAIRTSMATVFKQQCYRFGNVYDDLADLHQRGFRSVAMTLADDSIPLQQFQLDNRPTILMVGSEADGLPRDLQTIATDQVAIEMRMGVDSLNVSVAAGIAMYALTR